MKTNETVTVYTCDGCGKEDYATPDSEPPQGFHGASVLWLGAGGDGIDNWYACKERCIKAAVLGAFEREGDRN